ncbi:unnamed protein product [Trifolium pratense]|uniref:Uncharacterized protein n=1 Tax=Trifolium pratense TaxID=57577 RepID=A0ACB0LZ81_TRIPR|nr:unnamed protein product [Trifolium pratense]
MFESEDDNNWQAIHNSRQQQTSATLGVVKCMKPSPPQIQFKDGEDPTPHVRTSPPHSGITSISNPI